MTLAAFALAVTSAFVVALAFFRALLLERKRRVLALAGAAALISLSPLWVTCDARFIRFLAALIATAMMTKLYDLHITDLSSRPPFRAYIAFLLNPLCLVWKRLGTEPKPTVRQNLVRFAETFCKSAAGVALLLWLFHKNGQGVPFFVEHCIKVTAYFITVLPATALAVTIWRLAGGRARETMDAPMLAATPAEFWRRYNRMGGEFFYDDVFKPAGAWRAPVRAVMAAFVVSALVHEYVFSMSVGRVQGYQTLFFVLQGLAVVITIRLRPAGWKAWLWIGGTWLFNLTTSVLFFASVNGIIGFYFRDLPKWLAGW